MTFQIRDNLPDMDERIYKGEIRLLIPFADRIFTELSGFNGEGPLAIKKEDSSIEGRIICKSLDHSTG